MRILLLLALIACVMMNGYAADRVLSPLDIHSVKTTGGELGRRINITVENNLLVMDLEKDFLAPFHARNAKDGYIGLGKTLDALVRFAAYTGNPRVDEKRKQVVREIIALQEPDGYSGFFQKESRLFSLWDIHEMSYLIFGLLSDYEMFNDADALAAARKTADYIVNGWLKEPERLPGNGDLTTYMGVTGIEPALLRLYGITQDARYLDFCVKFRQLPEWDGLIVTGRWGKIQGHLYAYVSRCMAQGMLYDIQPDERLWTNTRNAMDYLVRGEGLTIIGACGQHECFHNTQDGVGNLGETCATAYTIRWWNDLMCREGTAQYGDLIERAMYNALFASQSPDGRHLRYYVPFEGKRVYFPGDTYCCPCNFRRIIAELPQMIYYTSADGIVVNLYTPSTATATEPGGVKVNLAQETAYPEDGRVRLDVRPEKPATFTLKLRMPRWSAAPVLTINGDPHAFKPVPGSFLAITREWQPNDVVEISFPMAPRLVKGRVAQAGRAAVMHGPLVFTLNRANNPGLKDQDLRLITIDPATLAGPFPDDSVHPGGVSCTVKAWLTTHWYPFDKHDWELKLTEYPDPDGEMIYFHVPNPNDPALTDDVW